MQEILEKRKELQEAMEFLGAMSSGLEGFMGRAANGMAFVAGKKLGKSGATGAGRASSPLDVVPLAEEILKKEGFLWKFELWKPAGTKEYLTKNEDGKDVLKLVFRDCMIRQSLFRYGHAQQGSLCFMMYGYFSGLIEGLLNKKSDLKILHSGENACLKELILG